MIRVVLPRPLCTLTGTGREITVEVDAPATQRRTLDALERAYPVLRGTLRNPATGERRPFVRFFAGENDLSHEPPDALLPAGVAGGTEVLYVVGAMAGG